jgi:hypothetical protein
MYILTKYFIFTYTHIFIELVYNRININKYSRYNKYIPNYIYFILMVSAPIISPFIIYNKICTFSLA